jgi:spore germination cell wall hydrolase CwlJ-like protein
LGSLSEAIGRALILLPRKNSPQLVALGAGVSLLAAAAILLPPRLADHSSRKAATADLTRLPSGKSLAIPNLNRPIATEDAIKVNALRPIDPGGDSPAARFRTANAGKSDIDRALECLSQAVYYEAGSESIDGARAVAQVVLNRVRHPGFPASVCGTVYQGSERVTGCQFTFTCDGSLRRIPDRAGWNRARKVATDALIKGVVFAPVGHSTHYHADYVVPYWAASLAKQAQIGAHIFYRLPGRLGGAAAFSQRYASNEPAPPQPLAEVVVADAISEALGTPAEIVPVDPLAAAKGGDVIVAGQPAPLAADKGRGLLVADNVGKLATQGGCLRTAPPAKDERRLSSSGKPGEAPASGSECSDK